MFVPFDSLPDDSRICVYQTNRKFKDKERQEIENEILKFVEELTAHGDGLQSSFTTRYNPFIIIAIDQGVYAPSACSIDSSVHFIHYLEQKYGVNLLDKMNV